MSGREEAMTDRSQIERLLKEAYAARKRGDVDAVCACFTDSPTFTMAGAQQASPIALRATDRDAFRAIIAGLIQTFEWLDHEILSMIIDGQKAAVHWRGRLRSTVTRDEVVTELVDLVTVEDGRIASLTEFCDTALAARMMEGQRAGAVAA
jgi:ketosteroid isomerase-like protein